MFFDARSSELALKCHEAIWLIADERKFPHLHKMFFILLVMPLLIVTVLFDTFYII